MRSIMKEIIKGPFLVLLFLIIKSGTNWRCEAATTVIAIPIVDSVSVPTGSNNITNNNPISISPAGNKTTTLVLPLTHSSAPPPLENEIKDVILVEEDNISIAQRSLPSPRCPIEKEKEEVGDKQKEENGGSNGGGSNLGNGNFKSGPGSAPPVKDEKVDTALEKISESISGVFNTIKNSVASIFSPGTGIPSSSESEDSEKMDCHNESTSSKPVAGGDGTNMISDSNDDDRDEDDDDDDEDDDKGEHQPEKLATEGGELLIHPVSSNDTRNNTNETNTSSTTAVPLIETTTTLLPVNNEEQNSTKASTTA